MIRWLSIYDLHLLTHDVTGVEHPYQLLQQEVLDKCMPFLYSYGFATDKQIIFQPAKHRSISKGVVVSYRCLGWSRTDREWRQDRRCDLHLHQNSPDFKGQVFDLTEYALEYDKIPMTLSEVEDDYDDVTKQLRALRDVLIHVRGLKDQVF